MIISDTVHGKIFYWWILLQILDKTISQSSDNSKMDINSTPVFSSVNISQNSSLCRDRSGYLNDSYFKIWTCRMCYYYLFSGYPDIKYEKCNNLTKFCVNNTEILYPTIDDKSSMDRSCRTLKDKIKCEQWTKCCKDAWKCCQNQKHRTQPLDGLEYCPQTWDGWKCWGFVRADTKESQICPSFLNYVDTDETRMVTKQCTINGTWYVNTANGKEWSDYSKCVPGDVNKLLKVYKQATIIGISFNSVGILLLVPAITVFIIYRQLRSQQRIKVHIHLFSSLLLSSVINMCWDTLVRYDRLVQDGANSLLHRDQLLQNPALMFMQTLIFRVNGVSSLHLHKSEIYLETGKTPTCKTLNILLQFSRSTNYFWMLCEAFFLHWVLVKAFSPPKHLAGYYIFGWGVPAVLSVVYALLRKFVADDNVCWNHLSSGSKARIQWIIYGPTILCNVLSFIFLLNILRILCRQLSSVQQEQNNFRKALKATFVLIPLFGIHEFFMIYRPSSDQQGYEVFQIASAIIINSQGIVISLIYCYFNGEVLSYIKLSWFRLRTSRKISESIKSLTSQTNDRRMSAISTTLNDVDVERLHRLTLTQRTNDIPHNVANNNDNNSNNNNDISNDSVSIRLTHLNELKDDCRNGHTNGFLNNTFSTYDEDK